MIVVLLVLLTAVFAVVGAEFVRSTCRRQLMSPAAVRTVGTTGTVEAE